jgi:hypothetical protein
LSLRKIANWPSAESRRGQDERIFLLASILHNAKVADEGLHVLSPYSGDTAKT